MVTKFWEVAGGRLADRWATAAVPALVFWLGGLLAWAYGRGGLYELATPTGWLDRQRTGTQLAVLVALLTIVGASAVLVGRLTAPCLRLLEGYWPSWLDRPRHKLMTKVEDRAADELRQWEQLSPRVLGTPDTATAEEVAALARLDQRLRRRPAATNRLLPTRLGNTLRAAETWPADKYGLDAVVLWPRLWLVLPDHVRQELLAARSALDGAVAAAVWGLLFCLFAGWTPLAIPIGVAVAAVAITVWAPPRAEIFADLVEAAFDLYRVAVYQQLRWPLPASPSAERADGQRLTIYLWRGSDDAHPTFTPPP